MPNPYFAFKEFTVYHDRCAMKVTTDACLFGAWCAVQVRKLNGKEALDIGTGTGLLSLMVMQKNRLLIDAIEINEQAAGQARENILSSPWPNEINIICEDVTQHHFDKQYDIIFSNPPFYENEIESSTSEKNTAHHSDGLTIEVLLGLIKKLLKEDGYFYLLVPFKRFRFIENELIKKGLFIQQQITIYHSPQHSPLRVMIEGSKKEAPAKKDDLFIRNNDGQYSEAFTELLKDYYLYL
jgi:tRNA1Val (adenine37-N6)-methyltransferase